MLVGPGCVPTSSKTQTLGWRIGPKALKNQRWELIFLALRGREGGREDGGREGGSEGGVSKTRTGKGRGRKGREREKEKREENALLLLQAEHDCRKGMKESKSRVSSTGSSRWNLQRHISPLRRGRRGRGRVELKRTLDWNDSAIGTPELEIRIDGDCRETGVVAVADEEEKREETKVSSKSIFLQPQSTSPSSDDNAGTGKRGRGKRVNALWVVYS